MCHIDLLQLPNPCTPLQLWSLLLRFDSTTLLNLQSSIYNPQPTILNLQSSIYNPQSSICNQCNDETMSSPHWKSKNDPCTEVMAAWNFCKLWHSTSASSAILNPKSTANPIPTIPNLQSTIPLRVPLGRIVSIRYLQDNETTISAPSKAPLI